MSYTDLPIPNRLVLSKEAIEIVQRDPELRVPLEVRGYTEAALNDGLSRQAAAHALFESRQVEFGAGVDATASLKVLEQEVRAFVGAHRTLARNALRGRGGLYGQLRLRQRITRSRENLLTTAQHFYRQLLELPEVLALLTPNGLTTEVVTSRLARLDAFEAAMQEQQFQRALAEVTTQRRVEAMALLDAWMLEFLGVARLVFKNDTKQLKKLGLPV